MLEEGGEWLRESRRSAAVLEADSARALVPGRGELRQQLLLLMKRSEGVMPDALTGGEEGECIPVNKLLIRGGTKERKSELKAVLSPDQVSKMSSKTSVEPELEADSDRRRDPEEDAAASRCGGGGCPSPVGGVPAPASRIMANCDADEGIEEHDSLTNEEEVEDGE